MHPNPDITLDAAPRLTRVQPHPHPDLRPLRPRLGEQVTLRVHRRRNRVLRRLERDEERIPLVVDLSPAVRGERRAQNPVMLRQKLRVPGAELLQQPRRPLHVGEEERDGATMKLRRGPPWRGD